MAGSGAAATLLDWVRRKAGSLLSEWWRWWRVGVWKAGTSILTSPGTLLTAVPKSKREKCTTGVPRPYLWELLPRNVIPKVPGRPGGQEAAGRTPAQHFAPRAETSNDSKFTSCCDYIFLTTRLHIPAWCLCAHACEHTCVRVCPGAHHFLCSLQPNLDPDHPLSKRWQDQHAIRRKKKLQVRFQCFGDAAGVQVNTKELFLLQQLFS